MARGRPRIPCPPDISERANALCQTELASHYDVALPVVRRWLAERGLHAAAFARTSDPVRTSKGRTWQALNTAEKIEAAKTPRKLEAFWAKVLKGDGCWTWASTYYNSRGYGQFALGGFNMNAHRAAWMICNG